MLLNQQGKQVQPTPYNVVNPLIREVKEVDNHKCYDMFKIGTRARLRSKHGDMRWDSSKEAYVNAH